MVYSIYMYIRTYKLKNFHQYILKIEYHRTKKKGGGGRGKYPRYIACTRPKIRIETVNIV